MELRDSRTTNFDHEEYHKELALADRRYEGDCWAWLVEQVNTIDEASRQVRRWPAHLDALHDLIDVLTDSDEHLIGVPKSRRMMVTWAVAEWVHWLTRYYPSVLAVWQSRTETMAAEVVDKRIIFAEEHLHEPALRRTADTHRTKDGLIGRVTWNSTSSRIVAVAQGADAFRSLTPTVLVMDECEFQEQGAAALAAAIPFAEKGAKVVLVSSSNGPGHPLANLCKAVGFTRWT